MIELGLTQAQLADSAEVAYRTIQRFYNTDGWREPAVIRAISVALQWPPDELERRVDQEVARQDAWLLESQVPGLLVLSIGEHVLEGLSDEELTELKATLRAVALQHVAGMKARTPGRGLAAASGGVLMAAVG